jgi:ribosome biogenesis GTPase A
MTAVGDNTVEVSAERQSIECAIASLLALCESGAGKNGICEKLMTLQGKLTSNRFHLAVLGQMKRGKSTFINALLGGIDNVPLHSTEIKASWSSVEIGISRMPPIVFSIGYSYSLSVNIPSSYRA